MWIEDFERLSKLDKMWLLEKDQEMFIEWQMWEDEQSKKQLPAKVTILIPKLDEVQSDSLPFP